MKAFSPSAGREVCWAFFDNRSVLDVAGSSGPRRSSHSELLDE